MTSISSLLTLAGRRALITGAGGRLGIIIAETLAELGASLELVDLSNCDLADQADALRARWGVNVNCHACDLESSEERSFLLDTVCRGGALSVLINNAAFVGTSSLQGWGVAFADQSLDTWRRALEVNLTAVFHLCQGFAPILESANGATIINIGSIYGIYGPDWGLYAGSEMGNPAAYGASKGALLQLTRWLATTLAPKVRVNALSPGGIFRQQPAQFVARYEARTPLSRMATEDDFRGAVAFLSSDMSSYVTGQNLIVDGGWGIW